MALTLTVEDGSNVTGANSYISRAAADTFFEGRAFDTTWEGASNDDKDAALVTAARILDSQFRWQGERTSADSQAMQWPRDGVHEPDRIVSSDEIPTEIRDAQCLVADGVLANSGGFFTRDPASGGADQIGSINLGQGALQIDYQPQSAGGASSNRYKTVVTGEVMMLVRKFGRFLHGSSMSRVRRA